jgi:hypothetical protein
METTLSPRAQKFVSRMRNPFLFNLFLLAKLPLAWVAGCRIKRIGSAGCEVQLPYGWRSQNPFNSIYFAAQSMAAEMSTGVLALLAIENSGQSVAMLVGEMEGGFTKKADRLVTFTCSDGDRMFAAVAETCRTGEPVTVRMETVGRMADGTEVSRFFFTWSLKRRSK